MSHFGPVLFVILSASLKNSLSIRIMNSSDSEFLAQNGRSRGINLNDPNRVTYLLYFKRSDIWVRMPSDGTVPSDLWNFGGDLKMVLHGFNGRPEREPMKVMESMMVVGREYAKKNSSLNIVAVNWTPLASRPIIQYSNAAHSTPEAGIAVAKYMMALKANKAFKRWSRVHMIGFSLGAHVAGIAAHEIQRLTGGRKIGRITGLDPAGPDFDNKDLKVPSDAALVLDKSDARYVDIIHCNMGTPPGGPGNVLGAVLAGTFGSIRQAGHSDFFPNGGERQVQCDEIQDRLGCSHNMCSLYYALSITTELPACPCRSWAFYTAGLCSCWTGDDGKAEYMGDLSNRRGTARGKYFLVVTNKLSLNYFS